MAELLIRIRDKVNKDFYFNARCTKRGDVILVKPDGWMWGVMELSHPDARIVKLPNIPLAEARAFLGREPDTDPFNPSRTLQPRAFKLDLDNLPSAAKVFIADDERRNPAVTLSITVTQLRALKLAKPRIQDPAVIGEPAGVLG